MNADLADHRLARVAAAIAEPARARMLCCLMDGHARTGTELAVVGEVTASTASVHLARLKEQQLVDVVAQGKHRYYRLAGTEVARALEALLVVAGLPQPGFQPTTPQRLRAARTCYDHMAGSVAVALHEHLQSQGWLVADGAGGTACELTAQGSQVLEALGVEVQAARQLRRRFACTCLDWSERRPHLGGALGAALLRLSLARGWLQQDLDSRALRLTRQGERGFQAGLGLRLAAQAG